MWPDGFANELRLERPLRLWTLVLVAGEVLVAVVLLFEPSNHVTFVTNLSESL